MTYRIDQLGIRITGARYDYSYANEIHSILYPDIVHFESGTLGCITGHSGVGKSAFLHCIALVDRFAAGLIEFGELRIDATGHQHLSGWRSRHIGISFQHHHLIGKKSVRENVELPLHFLGLDAQDNLAVDRALDAVSLSHRALSDPSTLSGGERCRAALARAIVHKPDILLCDEPTAGLDRDSAEIVMNLLRKEAKRGATVIAVTHDQSLIMSADTQVSFEPLNS